MSRQKNAAEGVAGETVVYEPRGAAVLVRLAGGLELALWCDLRIAGESATFGCFERRWRVRLVGGGGVPGLRHRKPV